MARSFISRSGSDKVTGFGGLIFARRLGFLRRFRSFFDCGHSILTAHFSFPLAPSFATQTLGLFVSLLKAVSVSSIHTSQQSSLGYFQVLLLMLSVRFVLYRGVDLDTWRALNRYEESGPEREFS
jgi:hypothetical protein